MANDIVVRIGAVLDPRSFDVVMGEIERRAKQAEQAVSRMRNAGGRNNGYGSNGSQQYGPSRGDIERAIAAQERLRANSEKKQTSEHDKSERQRTAQTIRELKARVQAEAALQRQRSAALSSQYRREESANAAHLAAMSRAETMASRRREREVDRFATRTSHRATRFFFPPPEGALGMARRFGHDIARGAGVDMTISGGLTRARERQSAATMLSNQGWDPDKQKFGERISAEELRKTAKKEAFRLGVSGEEEVMSAMTKFTDVTGDLATAKAVIGDIGLMARATGTNLTDAASAAADMAAQLPDSMDMQTRQRTMQMLLNTAASQGKRGAVEVKDLARYVPKIVSSASSFAGSPQETMTQLMATAQIARRFGGAANGAQAATAVSAMVNTLKTPARVKAFRARFEEAGLTGEHADIYDKKTGLLRSVPDIIKDSIAAASVAKDPQLAFKSMWGNVLGAKGPEGLSGVFKKAGGGKDGMKAIDDEFKKFTGVLDPVAQKQMLGEIEKDQTTSANRFQQELDKLTESIGAELYPTIKELAPKILQVAGFFGSLVTWAAANPFQAVVLAMTASVARAGIESGIRAILDRAASSIFGNALGSAAAGAVSGGGGAVSAASGLGKVGGVVAGVGAALGTIAALAAVGVAAYTVTDSLLKMADAANQKSERERVKSTNEIWQTGINEMGQAQDPLARQQAHSKARQSLLDAERKRTGVENLTEGSMSPEAKNTKRALDEAYLAMNAKDAERRQRGTEQQQYQSATGQSTLANDIGIIVAREMTGVMQKTLNVRVSNTDDFKFSSLVGGQSVNPPPREGQ